MSDRTSIVTEWIYCNGCREVVTVALSRPCGGFVADDVSATTREVGAGNAIVAGRLSALGPPHIQVALETEILPEIAMALCPGHSVRIVWLDDAPSLAGYRRGDNDPCVGVHAYRVSGPCGPLGERYIEGIVEKLSGQVDGSLVWGRL